jgi:hypothetical protein
VSFVVGHAEWSHKVPCLPVVQAAAFAAPCPLLIYKEPGQGVRLHDHERLFPSLGRPREEEPQHPISPGTRWALHLTTQDDQLLTEERVDHAMSSALGRVRSVSVPPTSERVLGLVHWRKRWRMRWENRGCGA